MGKRPSIHRFLYINLVYFSVYYVGNKALTFMNWMLFIYMQDLNS